MSYDEAGGKPMSRHRIRVHTGCMFSVHGFLRGASPYPPTPMLQTYLVEDSPVIRQSLITTLEELSAVRVVGTAEDEGNALAWLSDPAHRVDLVIIDIFLKGGSGLGVLRGIHQLALRCHVVVLTNYATEDMRQRCLALGASRVFDKSNEIEALIAYCDKLSGESLVTTTPAWLQ